MDTWVYYLWALLLVLASGVAWLTTLFTLPGNWFIAGLAALFAWLIPINDGRGVDWRTVFVLLGLALFGEIIEFGASAAGAAKQGASKRGIALSMVGAIVGSILGLTAGVPILIIGPFVGALVGGAAGAFFGATWAKPGKADQRLIALPSVKARSPAAFGARSLSWPSAPSCSRSWRGMRFFNSGLHGYHRYCGTTAGYSGFPPLINRPTRPAS